jgi:hypothetical protein
MYFHSEQQLEVEEIFICLLCGKCVNYKDRQFNRTSHLPLTHAWTGRLGPHLIVCLPEEFLDSSWATAALMSLS